jgi:hypothetical protein
MTPLARSLCLYAALAARGAALPGDCTATEAGSYRIDPRTISSITTQGSCSPGWSSAPPALVTACSAVHAPYASGMLDRRTPSQVAASDACDAVTCPAGISAQTCGTSPCGYTFPSGPFQQIDQAMVATKAAAMALSSSQCQACAAQYEIAGGFAACSVTADQWDSANNMMTASGNSCLHQSSLIDGCVVSWDAALSAQQYAGAADAIVLARSGYCLGWGTLTRCQVCPPSCCTTCCILALNPARAECAAWQRRRRNSAPVSVGRLPTTRPPLHRQTRGPYSFYARHALYWAVLPVRARAQLGRRLCRGRPVVHT